MEWIGETTRAGELVKPSSKTPYIDPGIRSHGDGFYRPAHARMSGKCRVRWLPCRNRLRGVAKQIRPPESATARLRDPLCSSHPRCSEPGPSGFAAAAPPG